MSSRSILLAVSLAVAVVTGGVVGAVGSVGTSATQDADERPLTECTTITEPGRYVLTGDVESNGGDYPCIDVRANNVTIDGDGHAISGTVRIGTGLADGYRHVTVRDVTLRGLDIGDATYLLVESATITGGIDGLYAGPLTVRDSRIGGSGVQFFEDAGPVVLENNTFDGRTGAVFAEDLENARIVDNRFEGTGLALFSLGDGTRDVLVADNRFDGDGISMQETIPLENVTIRSNVVTNATVGVSQLLSGVRIVENELRNNDVGIASGGGATVVNNRIVDNRVGVSAGGSAVVLRNNTIAGNDEFGVRGTADARNNYWGASDGPSSAPANDSDAPFADPVTGALANGSGDAVSEGDTPGVSNVRFDPFLTDEPDGVPPTDGSPPVDGNDSNATDEVYYQVDFVSGPVIERFGPPDSDRFYNDQSRLVRYVHASVADGRYQQDRIVEPAKLDPATDECVSVRSTSPPAFGRTSFTVEFTVADGCELQLTLAAYEKPGPGWSRANASEQRLVDVETATFGPGTHTLTVDLPATADGARATPTDTSRAAATDD